MRRFCLFLSGIVAFAGPAIASPGHGDDADSAEVEAGSANIGVTLHRLEGGPDNGDDLLQFGATYGASENLRLGMQVSFERVSGGPRQGETIGAEALYSLGALGPVKLAIYGTYDIGINRPDTIEARLVAQHSSGPIDLRFNLIGNKQLAAAEPVNFSYALAADYRISPRLQLGVHGFGEFGSFNGLLPNDGHAYGPVASYDLGGSVVLTAGYLFTMGNARQDTRGQLRLGLEFGF